MSCFYDCLTGKLVTTFSFIKSKTLRLKVFIRVKSLIKHIFGEFMSNSNERIQRIHQNDAYWMSNTHILLSRIFGVVKLVNNFSDGRFSFTVLNLFLRFFQFYSNYSVIFVSVKAQTPTTWISDDTNDWSAVVSLTLENIFEYFYVPSLGF